MLHALMCYLDERDYRQWSPFYAEAIQNAEPKGWLPFLSDHDLTVWRNIIAQQIAPTGKSQTIAILGKRVSVGEDGLRALCENPERMQNELWQYVSSNVIAEVEQNMYRSMSKWIIKYINGD